MKKLMIIAFMAVIGTAGVANAAADPKVTLCHATGSETNPYVQITVAAAAAYNGHLGQDHQNGEDVIPQFTFRGETYGPQGDQSILANGCVVDDPDPSPSPSPDPDPSPSPDPDPDPSPSPDPDPDPTDEPKPDDDSKTPPPPECGKQGNKCDPPEDLAMTGPRENAIAMGIGALLLAAIGGGALWFARRKAL